YTEALDRLYEDLSDGRDRAVDMVELWFWAQHIFRGQDSTAEDVVEGFQRQWAMVLGDPRAGRSVTLRSEQLVDAVRQAFSACGSPWKGARQHTVDLLIPARSAEEIVPGACEFVLGELHVAWNGLTAACIVRQHPAPSELQRAMDADFPEG